MKLSQVVTRRLGDWVIEAQQLDDSWLVIGHTGLIFREEAKDIDCETALRKFADKAGLATYAVLQLFGLPTS